jgi:hypothetical protein
LLKGGWRDTNRSLPPQPTPLSLTQSPGDAECTHRCLTLLPICHLLFPLTHQTGAFNGISLKRKKKAPSNKESYNYFAAPCPWYFYACVAVIIHYVELESQLSRGQSGTSAGSSSGDRGEALERALADGVHSYCDFCRPQAWKAETKNL